MALEYTLPVVLHIFRVDSDDRKIELCGGGGIHSPGYIERFIKMDI